MKTIAEIRMILAEHKNEIVEKYGVKEIGVFGSYLREEQKETSDIDILVEIKSDMSLLDFIGIKIELEEALKMKVDLVEYDTIKPIIKERILAQQVIIL